MLVEYRRDLAVGIALKQPVNLFDYLGAGFALLPCIGRNGDG